MEARELIYALGFIVTLALGIWNFVQGHFAARRASFINTVTAQRVLWLEQLRQDVSAFVGLTHTWTRTDEEEIQRRHELLTKVDQLRYLIPLRLNPGDALDHRVAELVKEIPELTDKSDRAQLYAALEELTKETQKMLKAEWEKVKAESKDGDIGEHANKAERANRVGSGLEP